MNILHITSAKTWRGGERQIQYLMEGLNENGHSNLLMSPKPSVIRFRSSDSVASHLIFKKGFIGRMINVFTLSKYCKTNNIDIIHGHDSHAHTLLWLSYKFGGLKPKSIITRRLINPIKPRSVAKYNYLKIDRIICISQAVKTILSPSIKDDNRLKVIHSAIKISSKIDIRKKAMDDSIFRVGYVAAFTKEKDHSTFMAVAKRLIIKYPEIQFKFILVGDGPLIEKYKIESQKINGQFEFTGFIEEVNQAYAEMDLLLHTSRSEALGTAILDAMQYGLPIVATNVGGIPEIVFNEFNGFLCEIGDYDKMADAVYKLASDKALYDEFSKNNQTIVPKFGVSTMVKKTLEMYREIIKR